MITEYTVVKANDKPGDKIELIIRKTETVYGVSTNSALKVTIPSENAKRIIEKRYAITMVPSVGKQDDRDLFVARSQPLIHVSPSTRIRDTV